MLADASGIMPDQLKFEADQKFFERGLDEVDVVVHVLDKYQTKVILKSNRKAILVKLNCRGQNLSIIDRRQSIHWSCRVNRP